MLLSAAPFAFAEKADPLPAVGDTVCGFVVKERREFPMIGAELVLFEHEKTGAGFLYVANNDINRAFDLTFFTRAIDNSGLPHVFEHATLNGSDKYPSDDLFFNLIYQTYNTFLNAMTGQLYTTYPMASLSEAQLLKYADFYTDSCLHPRILEQESIFREEAWRYRMDGPDAPLTIEGTVYSEMQTSYSLYTAAERNWMRASFPGATVGNVSGGDPAYIPDMTWEGLKAYHERYYHPSNCMAYLYGQFEDYTAFLRLLDEAFSGYEKREFSFEEEYTPISGPVEESFAFPAEASFDPNGGSMIYYSYICPGLNQDREQELVLNTLTDLLASDSSVLMQRLRQELPYGYFGAYIDRSGPEDAISFYAMYVNREDAPVFRSIVEEALADVAENGFSQDLVDGLMASLSLDLKLGRENTSLGISLITSELVPSIAETGNPFDYLDYVDALQKMDDWNRAGLYREAVSTRLLGSGKTVLAVTYPEPGLREEMDEAEARRLAEVKASMTDEELQAIMESAPAEKQEEDTARYLSELQAVTVSSLPEEIRRYEISDVTGEDGIRRITAAAGVEGIGQTMLMFDASGIRQEDLHWYALYTSLLGQLDTSAHSQQELSSLISRYLYCWNLRYSMPDTYGTKEYHPYLRTGFIALAEELEAGYDLLYEILFETQFTDAQALAGLIDREQSSMKSSVNLGAYSMMLYRQLGADSPVFAYYSHMTGLDYYNFLTETKQLMEEDPEAVMAKLQEIQQTFHNRTNAVTVFAGDPAVFSADEELARSFLAKLDAKPVEAVTYAFETPARSEALVVDSTVQYNGLVGDFETLGLDHYTKDLDAVAALVLDSYLVPKLREAYGVYTPMHDYIENGGAYLLTYSDPNIAETFAVYAELPELLASASADQETLDGYILSAYSGLARPEGELSGAISAVIGRICGEPEDLKIRHMEELKTLTPESLAAYTEAYANLSENGRLFTAGSAEAISANAELYDVIIDPFHALS